MTCTARLIACACLGAIVFASSLHAEPLPTLEVQTVEQPVKSARRWTTALAAHPEGPRLIAQYYNYVYHRPDMEAPPEWLIVDLQKGTQRRFNLPGYANTNYSHKNQLEAPNGRIFFSAMGCRIHYYEPATDSMQTLGPLLPSGSRYTFFYRLTIGPDGNLYATTQASHGRCALAVVDTQTLEVKVFTELGDVQREEGLTYGYYHAADPPWVYVGIGKGRWTLVAVNIETGEQKVLLDNYAWMSFGRHDGKVRLSAKLETGSGETELQKSGNRLISTNATNEYWWCLEGKVYPAHVDGTPDTLPERTRPVVEPPSRTAPQLTIDPASLEVAPPARDGTVAITWRNAAPAPTPAPGGSKGGDAAAASPARGTLHQATAHIESLAPILLESLIALPDGSLFGNAKQYEGFYRYDPAAPDDQRLTVYGKHGPSRPVFALQGDLVYFAGYPTSGLYVYDPAKRWRPAETPATPSEPEANPRRLKYLGTEDLSGAHYATALTAAESGRLYMMGRLERGHNGTGVAWYDPATGNAGGTHNNLGTLQPRGFALLESLDRIVVSGLLRPDPYTPGPLPDEAQLVIYDLDLAEQKRLTVKPGLHSTGWLIAPEASSPATIVGVISDRRPGVADDAPGGYALYRYDIAGEKLLGWRDLDVRISSVFQNSANGSWYTLDAEKVLSILNPTTLELTPVATLTRSISEPTPIGGALYGQWETELVRVALP